MTRATVHSPGLSCAAAAVLCVHATFAEARQFESVARVMDWVGASTRDNTETCVGDINADGYDDVLMLSGTNCGLRRPTSLLLGSPSGLQAPAEITWLPDTIPCQSLGDFFFHTTTPRARLVDLNGDGRADLIAIFGTRIEVWRAAEGPTFVFDHAIDTPSRIGLDVCDFDHDGDVDVVAQGVNTLSTLKNTGGVLSLTRTVRPSVGNIYGRIQFGRLAGGPGPDIALGYTAFLNDGFGGYTEDPFPLPFPALALVDVTNDGQDEILTGSSWFVTLPAGPLMPWWIPLDLPVSTIVPLIRTEFAYEPTTPIAPPFAGPYRFTPLPATPGSRAIGLLSADRTDSADEPWSSQIAVIESTPDGVAFPVVFSSAGAILRDVEPGDFDADGCPSVVMENLGTRVYLASFPDAMDNTFGSGLTVTDFDCSGSRFSVRAPRTAGETMPNVLTGSPYELLATRLADFNADGLPDLIVSRGNNAFNGNGEVGNPNKQLFFRNLGGRFDFSRPVYFSGSDAAFQRIELFDLGGDGTPEVYGFNNGVFALSTLPIEAVPQASPIFWDRQMAVSTSLTPLFALPTPSSSYSTGYSSLSRGPANTRMAFDATSDGEIDLVWFQNYRNWNNGGSVPSRVVVQRRNAPEVRSTTSARLASVAPIDFDGDGDTDLVGIERLSGTPQGQPSTACDCFSWDIADFPCTCLPAGTFKVLLNDGAGAFSTVETSIPTPAYSDWTWPELRSVDMTGDGIVDLVLTNFSSGDIRVFAGSPQGLQPTPIISQVGVGTDQPSFGDIDRDGDTDIISCADYLFPSPTTLIAEDRLVVMMNDGSGRLSRAPATAPLSVPSQKSPALADLDGDMDLDLVFLQSASLLTVSLNRTPPACSADFNADGVVSTADLVFFLGRFGQIASPGSLAKRADFNGNGTVDTPDLVFFLGRFGETCPR